MAPLSCSLCGSPDNACFSEELQLTWAGEEGVKWKRKGGLAYWPEAVPRRSAESFGRGETAAASQDSCQKKPCQLRPVASKAVPRGRSQRTPLARTGQVDSDGTRKNVTPLCPVSAKRVGIKEEEEEEKEEEEEDEEGKEGKGVGRRAGGKTTIRNVCFGRSSIIGLTVHLRARSGGLYDSTLRDALVGEIFKTGCSRFFVFLR